MISLSFPSPTPTPTPSGRFRGWGGACREAGGREGVGVLGKACPGRQRQVRAPYLPFTDSTLYWGGPWPGLCQRLAS